MARIRTIKPEFWTAEQIMECSPNARLLFIGMWNFCDDAGIHPASCKTLKAEVFPSDDITASEIGTLVAELEGQGLIEITKNSEWKLSPRFVGPECQRLPLHLWQPIRLQVFLRDGFVCTYCGAKGVSLECDHVVPISKGGTNDLSNLTTACVKCNRDKRDKTPEEWLGRNHG